MKGTRTSHQTGVPQKSAHQHQVQFYRRDQLLLEAAARFLSSVLRQHRSAIVVAAREHREELSESLKQAGLDIESARQTGRYTELDTEEFLSLVMSNGSPDAERFANMMDPLVVRAGHAAGGQTAIFSEAISVLCSKGQTEAAVQLERLWNELARRHRFVLLCGYAACHFLGPGHHEVFARICAMHSDVLPEESFLELDDDQRLRYVAELQQKVQTLDSELAERRHSEEALARSEKLAEMGRLAATIAHEINSPLTSLTNLIFLLSNQGSLDPAARQYVALADQELRRIARITKQVLGFSRESPKAVRCKVSQIMDDVLELYEPKLNKHSISVQKEYRVEGLIDGYPSEMRQVFANLIGNAIYAMGRGGKVRVRISAALNWQQGRRSVRISIADSGPGIPRKDLRLLFHPFFTTKGESGTGLGLWLSREIVKRHDGRISLSSGTLQDRHGTVFSIVLPAAGQKKQLPVKGKTLDPGKIAA